MLMTIDKGTGMAPFASAQVDVAPILKDHVDNIWNFNNAFEINGAIFTIF